MDKVLILAVAGSGKTTNLLDRLDLTSRTLIVTYTNNNAQNLRAGILIKFGYVPDNIKVKTYFTFLYSFCYKPFLASKHRSKGINWKRPPDFTLKLSRSNEKFYFDSNKRIYSGRIAKLLMQDNVIDDIRGRLEKYYDNFFIDEVQDFAGHDFNLLGELAKANLNMILVGDFFQHTFDTSTDGNVSSGLHRDIRSFVKAYTDFGFECDTTTLNKSHRCNSTVCEFIKNKLDIEMLPHDKRTANVKLVTNQDEVDQIYMNPKIIKLFYQEHHRYGCYSENWGACKGENKYHDVCVVLNPKTLMKFKNDTLNQLAPQTKNRFYVACSRTRDNLYFVPEKLLQKYKSNQ